jgi:6-phosphogluconolactonase
MLRNLIILLFLVFSLPLNVSGETTRFYIGTYTGKDYTGKESTAQGIYLSEFNTNDGSFLPPRLVAEMGNPSFLARHPFKPFLYTFGVFSGKWRIGAFAVDEKKEELTLLNTEAIPQPGACHLGICANVPDGPAALAVGCYSSGAASILPIRQDGSLAASTSTVLHAGNGPHPLWQKDAHIHSSYWLPQQDSRIAGTLIVNELGGDRVYRYTVTDLEKPLLRTDAELPPIVVPAGTGPRHLVVDAVGKRLYILGELDATISVADISGNEPVIVQRLSTLPEQVKVTDCNNATSEIFLHSNGKFLYSANRGHDSIALFVRNAETGRLTFIETVPSGGKNPRSFFLSPCGNWLISANVETDNVVSFRINQETGRLTPSGKEIKVGDPACVLPFTNNNF